MLKALSLAAVLTLCSSGAIGEEPPRAADALEVGEPVLAHNIAVVPLYSRQDPTPDDYLVLEEAQKAGAVVISENGGQVDRLLAFNKDSDRRPLYLLGGEVVLGGQQDRMVVNDTVVEAGKKLALEVRCVEHGRWSGADLTFRASEAVAHPDLRKAALFKGQGDVWNEVARKSAASGVASSTGTYRRVLQDAAVRQRIAAYLDDLQSRIVHNERLTGMAVAINGDLEVVDVFASPRLFKKLERKLLASYVLAALERQPGSEAVARRYDAKAKALKGGDINRFVGGNAKSAGPNAEGGLTDLGLNGRTWGKAAKGVPQGAAQEGAQQTEGGKVFYHQGKAVHGSFFGTQAAPGTGE